MSKVEKKYFVYDFKKQPIGLFTKKQCEEFFKLSWLWLRNYIDSERRVKGLYYIKRRKMYAYIKT